LKAIFRAAAEQKHARKRVAIYALVNTAKKTLKTGETTGEDDSRSFEQCPEIQIEAFG